MKLAVKFVLLLLIALSQAHRLLQDNTTSVVPVNSTNTTNSTESEASVDEGAMFASGFSQSFLLIFISEIGDKTFILVTIYAAKMRWWIVLLVASFGMCLMHSLSTGLGTLFILFIPKMWT